MGQVKEFHLLHGIILTKISRNEQPTLRLVETDASDVWAAYILNDEVIVYIRYSLTPRKTQRKGKTVWNFPFQPTELAKIKELRKRKPVYFALAAGLEKISDAKNMQVCLLSPEDIDACIDTNSDKRQSIVVEVQPRESLRAYGPLNSEEKHKLVISRNKLDEWKIPGS